MVCTDQLVLLKRMLLAFMRCVDPDDLKLPPYRIDGSSFDGALTSDASDTNPHTRVTDKLHNFTLPKQKSHRVAECSQSIVQNYFVLILVPGDIEHEVANKFKHYHHIIKHDDLRCTKKKGQ